MDILKLKTIPKISYEEVIKSLAISVKHLELKDVSSGKQPPNTIIIGLIKKDVRLPKMAMFKGSQRNRFFLSEIMSNGKEGKEFQIIVVGDYAAQLQTVLENIDSDGWLIFMNSVIFTYNGIRKDVSQLSLRIEDCNTDEYPKLIMMRQAQVQNSPSRSFNDKYMEYVTLNSITNKCKYNLFAVVQEVIKPTVILANGNKHTMIALVDPSCKMPDAVRQDLPSHIFFNTPNENFKQPIEEGDILRIREVLMEFYKKENKTYGKIYSCNAIVQFKKFEEDDNVTPITSNSSYILSEQDKNMVNELRNWWKIVVAGQLIQNEAANNIYEKEREEATDSLLNERTIIDITEPMTFTLFCKVIAIRHISAFNNFLILRVTDGTASKVAVNSVSLPEATQDLLSSNNKAMRGAKEIDIAIFETVKVSDNLQVNDFLKLEKVTAVNLNNEKDGTVSSDPILDFHMDQQNCKITILPETHIKSRQILNRLKSQTEPQEIDTSTDEIIQIARTLRNLDRKLGPKRKSDFKSMEFIGASPVRKKRNLDQAHDHNSSCDEEGSLDPVVPLLIQNNLNSNGTQCPVAVSTPIAGKVNAFNVHEMNQFEDEIEKNLHIIHNVSLESDRQPSSSLLVVAPSSPAPTLNERRFSEELSATMFSTKGVPKQPLVCEGPSLGSNDHDYISKKSKLHADKYLRSPTRLETTALPNSSDVTSSTVRSQLNSTSIYDGLTVDLDMVERTECHSAGTNRIRPLSQHCQLNFTQENSRKTVYKFGNLNSTDELMDLTGHTQNLKSLSQMVLSCKSGDTWQSYAILQEILTETDEKCTQCIETDDILCYHDLIWGMCTTGVHRLQPSELRKMYSKEALHTASVLYCKQCPLSSKNDSLDVHTDCSNSDSQRTEFPIEPFFKMVLKLRDITNNEEVYVNLEGDNAETFFGMKPSFFWTVSQCDIRLIFKFFNLEQRREMPLKFGFQCYESDERKFIQVFGTKCMHR